MADKKILDLLGKPNEKDTGVTEETSNAVKQGMGLPNEVDKGDGNPLAKMDEISKSNPDGTKDKKSDTSLNSDVLQQMFMTGDNTQGMFTPDEKKEVDGVKLHEEPVDEAKPKIKGDKVTPEGKYKEQFKKDFLKNPDDYEILTPKGKMKVSEAMRKGYDPTTKTFKKEHDSGEIKKKHLDRLNDADKETLDKFTNPENAQVAPADAKKYGLKEDSPMVKKPMPEQPAQPMGAPEAMPTGAPSPVGTALPGSEESTVAGGTPIPQVPQAPQASPAPGGADILSMLGGK